MVFYGRFRVRRGVGTRRSITRRRVSGYGRTGKKKMWKPKFAAVAFKRDIEKKYLDSGLSWGTEARGWGNSVEQNHRLRNGVTWTSRTAREQRFDEDSSADMAVVPTNMLARVPQGATAKNRIGNKINVKYVRGTTTVTAASVVKNVVQGDETMNGEVMLDNLDDPNALLYFKTTVRVMIVKDLQVNNATGNVEWADVMENGFGMFGVHSQLKVENMSRFVVLKDWIFDLDATDPQKTFKWAISGRDIGQVRFNSGAGTALTDKGIHMIWSASTVGCGGGGGADKLASAVVTQYRLCFTDC